ncbi:MAG: DNA polymerase III subunit delta [Bacteroidetes bacterium]|nr:DNA polymerase III subunit delta [Bacteroidota bacterium]
MMPTFNNLIKDLQKKVFQPVYLLYGEEPYYVDLISDYMVENVLDETEKTFNQVVLYGRDTSAPVLADQCRRFPMMGNFQLVVLREAQDMDLKKDENQQYIISYLKNPAPTTILVMGYKYKSPPVKVLNAAKKEEKNIVLFESKKRSESDLPIWISEQVNENGYTINNKACNMLVEFLGNNLEKISNELGKLYINHPKEKQITEDVIENYIGISKDYNVFELQKALANHDVIKANKIINYFAANPKDNSIFKIIPILFSFFSKLMNFHCLDKKSPADISGKLKISYYAVDEYAKAARFYPLPKTQDIITWLREANVRALGIDNYSVGEGELLKELIFKILH